MGQTRGSPLLNRAAQLSVRYLNKKVRSMKMSTSFCILFDGNDAQFLSEVD